jgi:hypothetical protein
MNKFIKCVITKLGVDYIIIKPLEINIKDINPNTRIIKVGFNIKKKTVKQNDYLQLMCGYIADHIKDFPVIDGMNKKDTFREIMKMKYLKKTVYINNEVQEIVKNVSSLTQQEIHSFITDIMIWGNEHIPEAMQEFYHQYDKIKENEYE